MQSQLRIQANELTGRLYDLSSFVPVKHAQLLEFKHLFNAEMLKFSKASVDLHCKRLSLMVAANGSSFAKRCAFYMLQQKTNSKGIKTFERLSQKLNNQNQYFKAEFGSGGATECSFYFRHRFPLNEALTLVCNKQLRKPDQEKVMRVAEALDLPGCYYGASSTSHTFDEKLYFFVPPHPHSYERISTALQEFPEALNAWNSLEHIRQKERAVVLSLGFSNGALTPWPKVDINAIPTQLLLEHIQQRPALSGAEEIVEKMQTITNSNEPGFVAFRLQDKEHLEERLSMGLCLK